MVVSGSLLAVCPKALRMKKGLRARKGIIKEAHIALSARDVFFIVPRLSLPGYSRGGVSILLLYPAIEREYSPDALIAAQ